MSETFAITIDNGSHTIRAGLGGDDSPKYLISNENKGEIEKFK